MRLRTGLPDEGSEPDAKLEQALKDFRSSIHAWSEAEYSRPHAATAIHHTSWRLAAGWALGCVLAAGSVTGGLYERHHRQEVAKIAAAAEAARQQKIADEQSARKDDEDLLAKVDNDVSRQVPSAMEPLAQMMAEDEAQ
jgi:hypothetical protein